MEITGKIIKSLPEQSGTSKAGNAWKKKIYVLETTDAYPKQVAFDFFGDRVDQYPLNIGDFVKISFDIESREFNERWYTDIRAWRAEPATPADGQPVPPVQQMPGGTPLPPEPQNLGSGNDDLPF